MLVEIDGGGIHGGNGERKAFVVTAAEGVDGLFHEGTSDSVLLVAGHHADLRGVADALLDCGCEDHADEAVACGRADEE